MTDKPIIFSATMIRALLDGRKTQKRRVLKPQPFDVDSSGRWYRMPSGGLSLNCHDLPYARGDRLWVQEPWACHMDEWAYEYDPAHRGNKSPGLNWMFPSDMPHWASRLTLTVTDVRVQRVREISEADVYAEAAMDRPKGPRLGSDVTARDNARNAMAKLWNSINGPDAWDRNDWVAALTFDVHRCNIDQMGAP
ncbi:MAG: hypothetical protein RI571_06450 [Roseovarius sp.]|nr:hypothetical protein [Roseovarius sp.]